MKSLIAIIRKVEKSFIGECLEVKIVNQGNAIDEVLSNFMRVFKNIIVGMNLTLLLFFIGTSVAYYWNDEPSLVNGNLKLAALGNLYLVLENYENEINLYDFGQLSAGIIDDDSGKSSIYLRSKYGFDKTPEFSSKRELVGGSIAMGKIYKYKKRWAIGGSFSGQKRDLGFYSIFEGYVRYDIKNTCDTVVFGFQPLKWISFGLRGAYRRDKIKTTKYINYWESDETTWLIDQSVAIALPGGKWYIGFGYSYIDDEYSPYYPGDIKALTLPIAIVYRVNNLTIGIKAKHKRTYPPDGDMPKKEIYGGIQGKYRIPFYSKTLNIGALVIRDNICYYGERGVPSHNWFIDFGGGVALIDNASGLLGIEIKHRRWQDYAAFYSKQTTLSFGFEFLPLKFLPFRIGYLHHWWNPRCPYKTYTKQMVVTMGLGVYFIDKKVKVDLAYNLGIGAFNWYGIPPEINQDRQKILGLSVRYTY